MMVGERKLAVNPVKGQTTLSQNFANELSRKSQQNRQKINQKEGFSFFFFLKGTDLVHAGAV
jgi:hypothetical protein